MKHCIGRANHQRMEWTGARLGRPACREGLSRGASFPSGVEPARRRFVKAFSYADCFFRHPLASSTYAELPDLRHSRRGLPSSGNRPMMTDHESAVQSNDAVARPTSGSNLTPGSLNLRKVRRAAAGFNARTVPNTCRHRSRHLHFLVPNRVKGRLLTSLSPLVNGLDLRTDGPLRWPALGTIHVRTSQEPVLQ